MDTQRSQDEQFMRAALEQAATGERTPGGAQVGCVIAREGKIVCAGFNEGDMHHDPTAHAEMVTIRRLCAQLEMMSLAGCTLYCTLQPCGMCTMACLWAGISRIVYGATRNDVSSVYFESRQFDTADFIRQAFRDDLQIEGGLLAEECARFYAKPGEPAPADPAHLPTEPSA